MPEADRRGEIERDDRIDALLRRIEIDLNEVRRLRGDVHGPGGRGDAGRPGRRGEDLRDQAVNLIGVAAYLALSIGTALGLAWIVGVI